MKTNTESLRADTFYHIYNRGINRENIFKEDANYIFFLKKYAKYIFPVARTYAYSLLRNHFHLLIYTRSEEEILASFPGYNIDKVITLQFSHLFNSYVQAVNKSYGRRGGLFETPYRRIAVEDNTYLVQLVYYIHFNPQKHGFTNDFTKYPYSSYQSYLSNKKTLLEREAGLELFGERQEFLTQHTFLKNSVIFENSSSLFID